MSNKPNTEGSWMGRSIFLNILLIIIVAALGIWIAYISIALFTKHGQRDIVPNVENMSYTEAIKKLNAAGFKVDIRDSLYRDDIKSGYVIEQFPKWKSEVKPGRKIFLYLNAVHPKQVLIDDGKNHAEAALKGLTERQAISRLEELGFKPEQIKLVKVLGENDRVVKILANGRTVRKGEKISVKAKIILEVYDGRLTLLRDSLQNMELSRAGRTYYYSTEKGHEGYFDPNAGSYSSESYYGSSYSSKSSYSSGSENSGSNSGSNNTPQSSEGEKTQPAEEKEYEFIE